MLDPSCGFHTTDRHTEMCLWPTSAVGMHIPFWDSELTWVPILLKLLFQQDICQREALWKSLLWFWLYFHGVINLGKCCFTCSQFVRSCANSAPSCETNKNKNKTRHLIPLLSFPQFLTSQGALQSAHTCAQKGHLAISQRTVAIWQPAGLLNFCFGQEGKKIAKCQGKLRKKFK